jgi:glycerophosphoryl diester phosphodiesterase
MEREETTTSSPADRSTPSRIPICFAHRGARAHTPENTLLAFDLAFDLGAEAIECDVQRSLDGRLIIIHDGTLERTTDGMGLVAARTCAESRTLNAGHRWRMRQPIPTLEETLELVWTRERSINLEVKGETAEEATSTAEAVATALAALDVEQRERVLVSSFALPAVARVKALVPELRVAALYGEREWRQRDMLAQAIEMGAEAIHPDVRLVTPALVRLAHAAGLRVNVWTANHWGTIARLIRMGVDGLFSDYPERVIISRARLSAVTAPA